MKKLIIAFLALTTVSTFASTTLKAITYVSTNSCLEAQQQARKTINDETELKSLLAGHNLSINSYEGYRLGDCKEEEHRFLFQTTISYYVPLYITIKRSKDLESVKLLELSKTFIEKDTNDAKVFVSNFKHKVLNNDFADKICQKYPELNQDEIDYISYKKGNYDFHLDGSVYSVVLVLKK